MCRVSYVRCIVAVTVWVCASRRMHAHERLLVIVRGGAIASKSMASLRAFFAFFSILLFGAGGGIRQRIALCGTHNSRVEAVRSESGVRCRRPDSHRVIIRVIFR